MKNDNSIKIGNRYSVKCVDSSFEGKGVAFAMDNAIFVSSMLPLDEGEVEITYKRNGSYFGKLVSLSKPSPFRIEPLCPIHSACGGCAFQSLSYDKEKEWKRDFVAKQLKRMGINAPVLDTIGMNVPYGYRNKTQVPFGNDKHGNLIYGFYREKSHDVVPFSDCPISDKRAIDVLEKLLPILRRHGVTAYEEDKGKGILRHALIRTAEYFDNIMLVLIVHEDTISGTPIVDEIKKEMPEITSFFINVNDKDTNVILGPKFIHAYGPERLKEKLCGITFEISPNSFFQVNSKMAEIVYKTAMDFANISKNDIVLDAYSGTGSIGLIAAKMGAKAVKAVEVVPEAVTNALENARANGIENYEAIVDDASSYMARAAKEKTDFDVLFVDPPRKGCSEEFIESTLSLRPKKIVYVSCNPISLARDLKALEKGYAIEEIQPIDQFPRTPHVETVVKLEIKK